MESAPSQPAAIAPWQQPDKIRLVCQMAASFQALVGQPLCGISIKDAAELSGDPDLTSPAATSAAATIYRSAEAVLCHDTAADPCFIYANRRALWLWELAWEEMIGLPSRISAEPDHRQARAAMLEQAARNGYISDYGGVRISGSGQRFRIEAVTIWNVSDADGAIVGQAAYIPTWRRLNGLGA